MRWRIPVTASQMQIPPVSFLVCAMWRPGRPPLTLITLPERSLVAAGGKPAGHMTGDFHCKEGRQEVEWKPGLSTGSLNAGPTARPSHCQQAQLGQAPRWPIVQWGLHVFTSFPQTAWEGVHRGNGPDQSRACYFYHHAGPQFSRSGRQKYLSAVESQHERTRRRQMMK